MSRIGPDADPQFTEEFLLNIPVAPDGDNSLSIAFGALTPEQQMNALIELQQIYREKAQLEAVELVAYLDGELALVVSVAMPDIMQQISFWQAFLDMKSDYRAYSDPE